MVELFASLDISGIPNDLAFDAGGNLYVSDSARGQVWKIDREGDVSTWKTDPLLLGLNPPGPPLGVSVGANGIAFDAGEQNLYVANTDYGRIVRIPVNGDGLAGEAEVFVEDKNALRGADGITFDSKKNLYVAVSIQDRLVLISPTGKLITLAEGTLLQNPASLQFGVGEEKNNLYVTSSAFLRFVGATFGTPRPALLKMSVEVP